MKVLAGPNRTRSGAVQSLESNDTLTAAGPRMKDTIVFSVPWFDIVAKPLAGSAQPFYVVRPGDYVSVLATTAEGSILLVRQYRPAVEAETLELPSGLVEHGEPPETAARRELAEETGYEGGVFELLGTMVPDTGRMENKLWCFYTEGATPVQSPWVGEEGVQVVRCEPRDLVRLVGEGKINHALNVAVLMLAAIRNRLRLFGQSLG